MCWVGINSSMLAKCWLNKGIAKCLYYIQIELQFDQLNCSSWKKNTPEDSSNMICHARSVWQNAEDHDSRWELAAAPHRCIMPATKAESYSVEAMCQATCCVSHCVSGNCKPSVSDSWWSGQLLSDETTAKLMWSAKDIWWSAQLLSDENTARLMCSRQHIYHTLAR